MSHGRTGRALLPPTSATAVLLPPTLPPVPPSPLPASPPAARTAGG